MGYYDKFLMHEDRRDKGMNSTTNEKGTDGKPNNSSAYNHDYYMRNKDKWGVGGAKYSEYSDGDSDFDEKNYDEKNRLGDTDFFGFQRPDGTWVILEEDMKWELPANASKEDLIKTLESFDKEMEAKRNSGEKYTADDWQKAATSAISGLSKGGSGEKEFDLDAAAMDVIRGKYKNGAERKAALGEDYEMVQKRVNELMRGQKTGSGSSSSSSNNKPATSSSTSTNSSEPHWRGKGGSSTSSTPAQNDQEKEEEKNKPAGRQRNITGSTSAPTRSGNVKHSEVYRNMNDWREYQDELFHHGIKGQKWGVRRFQNDDGTLTTAGQKRYGEKVTMHQGKTNVFVGGNKYKTHNEFKTANNFAKGTYKQNKARIKEEYKEARAKGEKGALYKSLAKRADNARQYNYELDRNRMNAGKTELKRDAIKGAATEGAKAAAKVGAGVLAGMLTANYMNNRLKRDGAGNLTAAGIDQHYEYKIGKAQVAKTLGKAVAIGALVGTTRSILKTEEAMERIDRANASDKTYNIQNSRRKRAEEDERRWKEGRV